VLALISAHLSELTEFDISEGGNSIKSIPTAPIIPPLTPVDTPLTPGDTVSQIIAYSSSWIDLCSSDPLIANISRQVLNIEVAYASFCGVGNIVISGPRTHGTEAADSDGLARYARAIQEALMIGSYIQIAIQIPMYGYEEVKDMTGDLAPLARGYGASGKAKENENEETALFGTWDAWNLIRSVCKYNSRLSVGKNPPYYNHSLPQLVRL
jgi:protein arginine N-methyltransferase 5